jgi:hypothetical protein
MARSARHNPTPWVIRRCACMPDKTRPTTTRKLWTNLISPRFSWLNTFANSFMRYTLISLLCLAGICPASTTLLNPSFEESDMSPWTRTAISGIRPWSLGSASPQDGSRYVFAADEASIEQSFGAILGSSITEFSFWIDRPASSTVLIELLFARGTTSGQTDISSVTGSGWWQYNVFSLVNPTDNITGIRVTKLGTGTTRLDNFRLSVVPEPQTGVLLAAGLLALLKQRRRRS